MLKRIKLIASGVISGALLPLAFAPYDLPYMAVIALVLFLFFLRPLNRLQSIKFGYAFGWGYFGHGVYWVYYSIHHFGHAPLWLAVIIMLGMVAILALYMALLAYLLNRFFQHNAAVRYLLAFPALWVGLEALRAVLFTGFPWLSLGYSQIDTWISAWGPITGVLGMSWLIVLTTGVIAYAFSESETFARESVFVRARQKEAKKRSLQGVNEHFEPVFNAAIAENGLAQRSQSTIRYKFIASLLLIVIWPGSILIGQIKWVEPLGEPIKVALLQGNIPQDMKWRKSFRQVSLSTYMTMSQQYRDADLIVWPETAVPMFYHRVKDSFLPTLKREAEQYHSDIVLGLPVMLDDGVGEYYNGLYSVRYPNQFYLKQHLVPLGEYLPLKPMSTILLNFLSIPMSDFSAGGANQSLLQGAGYPFSSSICYEDIFQRASLDGLPEAAYLVNVSNDTWFGDTIAPYQHLQMARMRALESGRYLLRSTNTGLTAIVNEYGQITKQAPMFERVALTGEITPLKGITPFVQGGWWLMMMATFTMLLITFTKHD